MATKEQKTKISKEASFFMKVVVIGDSGVGKTSILNNYIHGKKIEDYQNSHKPTIGSDLYMTEIKVEENTAQLQIWDTAGQERFNSISKQLYRGADILVLVYDITNEESYDNIENWKNSFLSTLSEDHQKPFPILLLGNKQDQVEQQIGFRKIDREKAKIYAEGHDMVFHEVSAVSGINIHPAFQDIALITMNKRVVPLVYKMNHAFCLPQTYYKQEQIELNENKTNTSPANGCYCELL